jgi:hypothetical protein
MAYTPKVGDIIRMHSWHGVVLGVFKSDENKTVLKIQTARNVFRNFNPEFIEIDLNPGAITPATMEDLQREIEQLQRIRDILMAEMIERVGARRAAEPEQAFLKAV